MLRQHQLIFRRRYTKDFFLDAKLRTLLPIDLIYFDVKIPFDIQEFRDCKQTCLLIGKVGTVPTSFVYTITDKRNV